MSSTSIVDPNVPEFCSIFLHAHSSHQLGICSSFKSHIESCIPSREATIKRPGTCQKWKVDLVNVSNKYFFKQGWENFVKDNSLEDEDFMVFRFHGNCTFTVKIYGKHGCLKESVVEGEEIADVELIDDGGRDDDGLITVEKRSRAGKPSVKDKVILKQKRCRVGRPGGEDPKSEAVKAAKFYMRTHTNYPSFRVSIGLGYVKHHLLNVPLNFANTHMKGNDQRNINLQVMDRIWSVTMLVYRKSSSPNCKLSKGVSAFLEDNMIQDGDVCVFELVKPDTFKGSSHHYCHGKTEREGYVKE